ncbi:MAG: cache domain-containing protein [Rhodospirillaceae bacterium]|nr:cache domain-containing protein [Rhodospirillales bacterium]
MSWSLARKVSVALFAILLATMLTTAVFGYYKFEDVLSSLVRSRYSFVVFTIKQKVEDSLNLGFSLRQIRQVQDVIELEKARDDQIHGIDVYDHNGEVLFDTDRGVMGSRVPARWLEPLASPSGTAGATQPFSFIDEDAMVVGLPLVNSLGKVEGAVVLRYPEAYLERELGNLLGRLALEFLTVLSAFALAGTLAAYVLLRVVGRRLGAMETTLAKVLAVGGEAVPNPNADEFELRFAEFCDKSREAVEQITEASAEVERLDRLA